ncbi:hypothetical protein ACQ86N_25240 [Puia sp. P3]|uniref:hypothetical protein n=1 Tax=Puia sp. P3 TaxID=3423952 RepID=UPI003D674D73
MLIKINNGIGVLIAYAFRRPACPHVAARCSATARAADSVREQRLSARYCGVTNYYGYVSPAIPALTGSQSQAIVGYSVIRLRKLAVYPYGGLSGDQE